jgi:DNA ligase-1
MPRHVKNATPGPSSEAAGTAALLADFAVTAERVGATTKRLEKAAILGEYFAPLSNAALSLAARYFAGYTFPLRDQRTTNVGGAALFAAVAAVSSTDEAAFSRRIVALGDLGDAAFEVFAASPVAARRETALTLVELAAFFEQLAETSGAKRKLELVTNVLAGAAPLEAKYVVKLLVSDLRIGLKEGAVEDALARLYGAPVARVQWANMLTGDIGETALLARAGRLEEARMRLFHPIKFMLATPAADLSDVARQMPEEFAVEDKFDGIRAQAHVAPAADHDEAIHGVLEDGRRVALFSRTLDEITKSFPDLVAPLAALVRTGPGAGEEAGLILDGEIVPVQGERILPFQELQKRLGRKTLPADLLASVPVAFVAYDALYGQGDVLINEPFAMRRAVLESLDLGQGGARRADSRLFQEVAALDDEFDAARARGNEGLMVKDPRSPYKPGRRGRDWLKIKRALATLDVVVTAVEVGNGRRHHLLSDYTFAVRASEEDPTLLNVGKAYSGLTDAELAELSTWFREHTLQQFAHGKVRVVEPRIVIEVTFDRVQVSKRHKSGYALRFPRILRVRDDKSPDEIDTLEVVRRLAEGEEGDADPVFVPRPDLE